ncbi:hypothetical protein [Fluviicola taffensis]|nr:hypothetical protein [Fluviicola taffensis]
MNLKIAASMIFLLYACEMGTKPMFDKCEERPQTLKEQFFVDSLNSVYNNHASILRVDYQYKPNYKLTCEDDGKKYYLNLLGLMDSQMNDTAFRRQLAKDLSFRLYNRVLEDSIKYFINSFEVSIGNFDSEYDKRFNIDFTIYKSDIENYIGSKLMVKNKSFFYKKIQKVYELKYVEKIEN